MIIGYSKSRFGRRIKKRRKIFRLSILIKLFLLCAIAFLGYKTFFSLPVVSAEITATSSLTQPSINVSWPNYGSGAIGAIGFDGVLSSHGDQSARPIASITKVITALVVLNIRPIAGGEQGPSIQITQADLDIFGRGLLQEAAMSPVYVGTSLTERQVIELMLLPSAANYSETLAVWAYGSVDAYLIAANNWLQSSGMMNTIVTDTSGLSPGNVSTPNDLIILAKLAMANSTVASVSAMATSEIPIIGTIINTNWLLGEAGVNGIKTGSTDEAGICLLFSSVINVGGKQVTVVGSILNGTNRATENADVKRLLKSVEPGFRDVAITSVGKEYAKYTTLWDQTTNLVSNQDISTLVWSDTPITVSVVADDITTVKSGAQAGTAMINIGGKVTKVPLFISNSISKPRFIWRLTNILDLF